MPESPHRASTPLGPHEGLYTDLYQLTMAQGHFAEGRADREACFDYFFRSNPFDGGYVVFAGLDTALDLLESFEFDDEAIAYLETFDFDDAFLDYLRDFEFEAEVHAPREGEVVFPLEPIVRVEGDIIESQIVETLLLNVLNFESLIATKASRMRQSAGEHHKLIDFGLRRAQGFGAVQASRAAIIGGFDATSNVWTAFHQGLEATGTQAHAWIQSFDSELEAFRAYARTFPDRTILLVDTYDTLESGIPNAIQVARELEQEGHRLKGIRLDSGDLAYLAGEAREMLDEAGLEYVDIAVSNQLDEHVSRSLRDQGAPIDVFGVGTQLVTAYDCPALDGVYKLSWFGDEPRLKLSENPIKINFPGRKRVDRLIDDEGQFYGDAVALEDESPVEHIYDPSHPDVHNIDVAHYDREPLLRPVMEGGEVQIDRRSVETCREYAHRRLDQLPDGHKRFEHPHIYKVGLSGDLLALRDDVVERTRERTQE